MRLDDLFDDEGKDQEETWTSDIPIALIEAQEAEEAQREAEETGQAPPSSSSTSSSKHHSDNGSAALPQPPALPRQLEKVILNSSPANRAMVAAQLEAQLTITVSFPLPIMSC